MINANEGRVTIKGSATELLADLTTAIESVVETFSEDFSREDALDMVEEAYKLGTMTKEEQQKYIKENIQNIINEMFKEGEQADE